MMIACQRSDSYLLIQSSGGHGWLPPLSSWRLRPYRLHCLCQAGGWDRIGYTVFMGAGSQEAQHSKPERLSTDRSDLRGHESVRAPGSQVPQGSHWSSAGPAPVCLPGQQIRWWCCRACPASLSAAPRDPQHICQGVVRGFLFSVQHNHPTEAVWQTDPHGRREVSVRVDSELPPGQAPVSENRQANLRDHPQRLGPSGVCSHLCCPHCSQMTACNQSPLLSWLSFQMTLYWRVWSKTMMSRPTVERLTGWCSENDLELNVSKTKEMVFDFRKKKTPLVITHHRWQGSWRSKNIQISWHNHLLRPKMGREY